MKIYTKTGDKGQTSLFGGTRVPKYNIRIEAYGTVDELNAYIGLVRDQDIDDNTKSILLKIQHELFTLGAMLATPPEKELLKSGKERLTIEKINDEKIALLENEIDVMNESLPPMTHFILPGGNPIVSYCHIARCICRRAERIVTQLSDESTVNPQILMYLNRLSDYLFVLARKLTYDTKSSEIQWIPENKK
jgi:cob(I)alamin adenosyltransferase